MSVTPQSPVRAAPASQRKRRAAALATVQPVVAQPDRRLDAELDDCRERSRGEHDGGKAAASVVKALVRSACARSRRRRRGTC